MWQRLLAIVVRPSHGGRHIGAPGVVEQQFRSPPGLAHDREVVDISDRCEKIPRALLLNRNRWPKGRAQAHCLLSSPRKFCIPAPPPRVGSRGGPEPKLHRGRPSDFNPRPIPSIPFRGRPPWQRRPIDRVAGPRSPSDDPGCRASTFPPAKMATCGGGGSWAVRPHT